MKKGYTETKGMAKLTFETNGGNAILINRAEYEIILIRQAKRSF